MKDTKQFYFIKIAEKFIGMDKQLTEDFRMAHTYQGDQTKMIEKLVKQGYDESDIEIFTFELKEAAIKAIIRERRIDSILED